MDQHHDPLAEPGSLGGDIAALQKGSYARSAKTFAPGAQKDKSNSVKCGVCGGSGAIYDCGCLDIDIPEGSNPYDECVDITIEEIYNQYDSCDDNLAEFQSTIGLVVGYEDVTASNGPRVITLQDLSLIHI